MADRINTVVPADGAFDITPADDADLAQQVRGIFIGDISGGDDLKVDFVDGTTITFTGVNEGTILPFRVNKVYDTGTSAASLVGLY